MSKRLVAHDEDTEFKQGIIAVACILCIESVNPTDFSAQSLSSFQFERGEFISQRSVCGLQLCVTF